MININEIISILSEIKILIDSDSTDVTWSRYNTVEELLTDIDSHLHCLKNNDLSKQDELTTLFLPTGSLQEISIDSGWEDKFLIFASRFDNATSR